MAPRKKTGVKDFYAQSKKNTSQRKKSGAPLKSQVRITSTEGRGDSIPATVGSSVVQPAVLNAYGRTDHPDGIEEREEILRQFDMNLSYGPCLGVPRLERWERASKLGLNPPKKIKELLENAGGMPDCLWEGLV